MDRRTSIKDIHAQELDSWIAAVIDRPIIRVNNLVRKIPLYFVEIPRSKPDLSQPVVPVTISVTASASCRGTQSCDTCAPFVAQGCSDTLCSLSVLRTDHRHVSQERRRRSQAHPLSDGTNLIQRTALLNALEDEDDIDWN
jgi:hypothetical protein